RPRTAIRLDLVNANVPEIAEGRDSERDPSIWPHLETDRGRAPSFRILNLRHTPDSPNKILVKPVRNSQSGTGRMHSRIFAIEGAAQHTLAVDQETDREETNQQAQHDERGARLVRREIAQHFAPTWTEPQSSHSSSASELANLPSESRTNRYCQVPRMAPQASKYAR